MQSHKKHKIDLCAIFRFKLVLLERVFGLKKSVFRSPRNKVKTQIFYTSRNSKTKKNHSKTEKNHSNVTVDLAKSRTGSLKEVMILEKVKLANFFRAPFFQMLRRSAWRNAQCIMDQNVSINAIKKKTWFAEQMDERISINATSKSNIASELH